MNRPTVASIELMYWTVVGAGVVLSVVIVIVRWR